MSDNEIKIKASVKDDASSGIKKIGENINDAGKAGSKTATELNKTAQATENLGKKSKTFSELFERARKSCTTMSFALADLTIQAGKTIATFVKANFSEAIKGFSENEMAANRLTSALKNQGIYSSYVAKDLDNYAKSLRELTGENDDVIKDNMRLLVNYGLLGDELKRATKAAILFSSATGMDISSAMQYMAKATEGSYRGFQQWGIKVRESGTQTQKFSELLGILEKKFGDIVNVNADNMLVQIKLLKEQWGDFKEQLAGQIAPLLNQILGIFNNRLAVKEKINELSDIEINYLDKEISLNEQLKKQQEDLITLKKFAPGAKEKIAESESAIEMTKKEIELNDQKMQGLLESRRIEKENADIQTANAQKRIADAKAEEEAQNKKEEEAKKELERQKELESKKADLLISSTQSVLQKVADLNNSYSGLEYAEKVNQYNDDYNAKISFLDAQAAAIAAKYGEESYQYQLLIAQKEALEQEYSQFKDAEESARAEKTSAWWALDLYLAKKSTKAKIAVLNELASMQNSKIEFMASLGKAAAITQATIDTYSGIGRALGAYAPPYSFVMAALVAAQGFENVANIAGVQLAVGTGYVPQDMQATIHKGEIVVPKTFSDAIRAGDMSLSAGDSITNNTNTTGGSSAIEININVAGDIIGDTSNNLAKSIQTRISKFIATGQTKPFPTREKM